MVMVFANRNFFNCKFTVLCLMHVQCGNASQFGYPLGHSWSFWKETYFEWIKWGKLYGLWHNFRLSFLFILKGDSCMSTSSIILCFLNVCYNNIDFATLFISFSLFGIRLHMHFLKVWRWLLVLGRHLSSVKQDLLWKLLLRKLKQSQVHISLPCAELLVQSRYLLF